MRWTGSRMRSARTELTRARQELPERPQGRQLLRLHVHAPAPHLPGKGQGSGLRIAPASRISWMTCLPPPGPRIVEFPLKTACCGGAHTLSDSDTSTKLVLNILTTAEACGAEVIATECPTCHTGLEMHQVRAEKVLGRKTNGEDPLFHPASGHGARPFGSARSACTKTCRNRANSCAKRGWDERATGLCRHQRTAAARPAGRDRAGRWRRTCRAVARAVGRASRHGETVAGKLARVNGPRAGRKRVEGFRLLALHRQGARGDPSFNACRETCRELVYHAIVARMLDGDDAARALRLRRDGGCAISRCSSAANSRSPGWASSAVRRARCVRPIMPARPQALETGELTCPLSVAATFPTICSMTWPTTSGTAPNADGTFTSA